jgi:hypothetical protein
MEKERYRTKKQKALNSSRKQHTAAEREAISSSRKL